MSLAAGESMAVDLLGQPGGSPTSAAPAEPGKKKSALAVQFGEAEVRSRKPSTASIAGVA
ncbi:unnamed protein product, partial [Amoebophrya sp. A25]|eukprot:GSA25T00020791001.1